ncbi:helix-turn-helix transcriptional regulator [Caldivirga maquilingensis]|uniref:Uncharacterized membrane-associated protein n=1 Tax=Caldivirga maquilingensis (strain ATCC 700844 / DSM 13496 / JCM 10307 / IC-167) TaxID=397948 RepID=A8M990_CALMQ|nr:MarR family transcriptional regulator [Caldivirga maquilingensis]ABW02309.1 Uncharacterized membrane-associated protein [Caldivirga maquilingensis IC-167]
MTSDAVHTILLVVGASLIIIGLLLIYGGLVMINRMAYYHMMGMMGGFLAYYPLLLPTALLVIGALLIFVPMMGRRNHAAVLSTSVNASTNAEPVNDLERVLRLLPRQERDVLRYIVKSGGEVYQYQLTRDLGLSKVRVWRIVKRLEEKGLVEVVKVKGRNIIKVKDFKSNGD